eukprot:CAMPEP_0206244836 /NCGR_PEP_ID=MMETSP0047_2-20121206/18375_1 /ASSEMBLY_ACC=CAM_ASM_000192 /TAXON_ID=195065 /ORGANISM="Chroomonas mesostigmatica_cf, Strain CCMP1168" /LENGTH=348 /DNA_ID=CAMNT_0053670093 /DNA_START=57 /DNA_END=1103 /DNA_ORIENTATION=+
MANLMGSMPFVLGVPVAVIGLLSAVSPSAANFLNKFFLFFRAFVHLVLTTESPKSKIKKLPDPDLIANTPTQKVQVIFVRHAESTWNEVFNKGSGVERFALMPFRIIKALINELLVSASGSSVFLDSPLSDEGLIQARTLLAFVEGKGETEKKGDASDSLVRLLRGEEGKSILVSSNLQRSLETMTIGFWGRLQRSGERVHVLSDLQEISRNIDTFSLSHLKTLPPLLNLGASLEYPQFEADKRFEVSENKGQKEVFENAMDRITRFAEWLHTSKEAQGHTVIVGGHSLYFKTFFQCYVGKSIDHISKKKKIVNGGAVAFTFEKGIADGQTVYRVDPSSINIITGGFK